MSRAVSITTYNIPKGMSPLNRRLQLPQMVDALQHLDTDILFLQEVQGVHHKRQQSVPEFPAEPHGEVIGRQLAFACSYGQNATYAGRHHGNAILSLCVHLNLRETDRKRQYRTIADYIEHQIPSDAPLILAGDFNDWRQRSCSRFGQLLGLDEAFAHLPAGRPKTFPARLPILSLDRIYTRHLTVLNAVSHQGLPWQQLSDHLPLSAVVVPKW